MIDEDLAFLGAPAPVRSVLSSLPPAFASAVAADARRIVEAESLPVRPSVPDDFHLVPLASPLAAYYEDGVEHPAVLRWRIVLELMRLDAGRLRAWCNAFRFMLASWRANYGTDLEPDGPDCPPLDGRPWSMADDERTDRDDRETVQTLATIPDEVDAMFKAMLRRRGINPESLAVCGQ